MDLEMKSGYQKADISLFLVLTIDYNIYLFTVQSLKYDGKN